VQAQLAADQNAQAAEVQRGLALDALNGLVSRVQNQLRETPDTQQLKQDLLRTGLDGLRKVAASAKGARRADAMMAEAYQRMGDIFQNLAQHKEAREQYEQSHAIRLELAKTGTAAAHSNLALSFTKLGDISLLEGDRKLAHQHYSEALRLREALATNAQDTAAQINLATSFIKVGGVSEPEEERKYYGRALTIRQSIAASTTGSTRPNRERDVWITFNKLAELSLQLKEVSAASEYYDQALAQAVKIQGLVPTSTRAKSDLAVSYMRAGAVRARLGESDAAKSDFAQALDLLQPLAGDDPRNLDLQTNLALALARHGDHAQAAEKAETVRSLAPQNYLNLYNVACCYSLAASAVAEGRPELTADETTAHKRYADQAIAALRQAADRGLKGTEGVDSDPDLEAIRSHPEYPQLLEVLRKSAP
jgi:tetratricopeptide (TPR) repeat protein